jgi:tetratricopeptide (TPR) repeat protein
VAEPALLAAHARLARRLGLRERAAELVTQAELAGRPTAEVPVARALLLLDEGRFADALAALRLAEPLSFAGPLEGQQQRELRLLLGETLVALGELDAAAREAGRVLLDEPADVRALRLQGAIAAARGQLDDAAAACAAALAAAPDDGPALTAAGLIAARRGDGDGARRLLEQARAADPVRAMGAILALGFVYEDAGREEPARDTYAQALELEPGHAEALYRLGRRQRQDGDPAEAMATLRKALALSGPETLLLLELSRAALDRERWEDAQRYAREAERLEPGNAEVQWSLGLAVLYAGDVLGCVAPLEKAVAAGAPGAHAALAVALYRRGQAQAALSHLDELAKAYAGRESDPQAAYAARQAAAIRDNLSKRQWLDRFGRTTLQRGWTEHVWDGSPRVFLDAGVLRVAGRMERPRTDEQPGVTRPVDGRGFFGCAAELVPGAPGETRAGLSLTYSQVKGSQGKLPKARLSVWVDTDGQVRLSVLDNFDTAVLDGQPAGVTVPPGGAVLLGIERLDDLAGRFAFSVDGRRVGPEVECKSLRNFRNPFELSVWAEAAPGAQADASLRLVRVVQAP